MTEEKQSTWVEQKIAQRRRIKEQVNQRIQENQTQNKPHKGVKQTRRYQREAKQEVKLAKQEYQVAKKTQSNHLAASKEKLNTAREKHKVTKKVHKAAMNRNGGSRTKKVARKGYQTTRSTVESTVRDNDTLGDIASSRQKIRHNQATVRQSKKIAKYSYNLGKSMVGGAYNLGNRGYNFARGRGFTRTLKNERWETKVANRLKKIRGRLARSKLGKTAKTTSRVFNVFTKPARTILKNPLSLKAYITMFVLFLILAIFTGGNPPTAMEQDEFELNQSWLYLSKIDREKSTDKVDYWTNIDDIVFYMNYRYGDYKLDDRWITSNQVGSDVSKTYKNALTGIWNHLNSDTDHLKEMADLYGKDSKIAWMILSKDERKEYEELLSESKELGRYSVYQELDNPFYTDKDEAHYNSPLRIIKRFGYISKSKIYYGSVLQANAGQQLLAVMSGTVKVSGTDITIETKESKFTYKDVSGIRFKTGDTIEQGTFIGTVKSSTGQEVYYQKQEEKATKKQKAKWTYVNVGFYFRLVNYTQTTSVMTNLDISGDLAQRSRAVRDHIKNKIPNATDNGIAAVLGNFATESNIKAKRAESDYLSPPIGATASSWDDENWLNMGFAQGASVGSLVVHRGLGLGMWTDTSDGAIRNTLLRNYAKSKGKKWYDLETQIDFMLEGDNPYYIHILKSILTSNENVATLTQRFLVHWEGNAGDKLAQRQNNAKQMLMYFKQTIKGSGTLASSWNFPEEYRSRIKHPPSTAAMTTQAGNGYPVGQCTWYAYNRLVELGKITDLSGSYGYLGNGQNWVMSLIGKGWKLSATPVEGAVVSTAGGFDGTLPQYGHVGIVEVVNADGSFLVSELNYAGNQSQIHWRVCRPAAYYTFATR